MALSAQNVIDAGYAKSAAALIGDIASPAELVTRIGQCLREVFLILARENPYIIGTQAIAAFGATGWARPADALRVIKVNANAGTVAVPPYLTGEIAVVAFNDQLFAKGKPSVTELGQVFIPVGQTMDPSGGTLTIIYARAPQIPLQASDPIDPLFPEFFADFLAYDVAAYLASKDERAEDEQTFLGMKSADLQQIIQWSRGQTYSLRSRFPIVQPPLTNTNGGKQTPAEA